MQQLCCLPLQQRGALSLTDRPGPRTQALGGFDTLENLEIPLVDQSRVLETSFYRDGCSFLRCIMVTSWLPA